MSFLSRVRVTVLLFHFVVTTLSASKMVIQVMLLPSPICFISISVRLFCVVILLHPCDLTPIAEGKVVCWEVVHGITLNKVEEAAVNVVRLLTNYGVVHPQHEYPIEAGGFTAWPAWGGSSTLN